MRRYATTTFLTGLLLLLAALPVQAQQDKLAQTGFKFLSLSVDARAAAMGGAMTAIENNSMALFYNPATMSRQEPAMHLALAKAQWIADINYNQASASFRPWGGRLGVFGVSFVSVDYGDLQATIRANNEQGFIDVGSFSPTAYALGVGYARALTDRFSVGGHVKIAKQDLGANVDRIDDADGSYVMNSNSLSVVAYDFGMLYRTGFRSLNFAVSARNFAEEVAYVTETFQLPLTLKIGVAMDVLDLTDNASGVHQLIVAVDAENPRDYAEQIKLGGEYLFMERFALRAGYAFPSDEQGINLGLGIRQGLGGLDFGADYAYTDFGVFNDFSKVHRVALQFSF